CSHRIHPLVRIIFCRASPDEALRVCVSTLLRIGRKDLPVLSLADCEDVLSNAGTSERVSDLGGDCDGFLALGHKESCPNHPVCRDANAAFRVNLGTGDVE